MAKELLIVEEPIVCDMCWLSVRKVKGVYCRYKHRYNEEHKKPTWCPLIPMPKKIESGKIEDGTKTNIPIPVEHFAMGWNACIKEISNED